VRERLAAAANFTAWTDAVERCLADAGDRIPREADRRAASPSDRGAARSGRRCGTAVTSDEPVQ
jgi:hypothetical protein